MGTWKCSQLFAVSAVAGLSLCGCSSSAAKPVAAQAQSPLATAVAAQRPLGAAQAADFADTTDGAPAGGKYYHFTSPNGEFTCGIVQLPNTAAKAGCAGAIPPNAPRTVIAGEYDNGELRSPTTITVAKGVAAAFGYDDPATFQGAGGPARQLPYGHPLSAQGLTCAVFQATGVSCDDGGGHGFTVTDRDYLAH
jgi:hypothetical protein